MGNMDRNVKKIFLFDLNQKLLITSLILLSCVLLSSSCFAQGSDMTIGGVASMIVKSFRNIARLITAASYLSGLGFAIGAIMKFKQHKDNPTQIPIGTPIALLFIASALLFLPSVLGTSGVTLFGPGGGTVAGPSGIIFS